MLQLGVLPCMLFSSFRRVLSLDINTI